MATEIRAQPGREILRQLHAAGVIASTDASVRPLAGGVSSEIMLVDDGRRPVVDGSTRHRSCSQPRGLSSPWASRP